MRVVLSFTALPHRLGLCQEMIGSLLLQTRKPDRIVMVLPEVCARGGAGYEIPDWFPSEIEVLRVCRDLGPALKLVPILAEETSPDDCLITVDDDVVYHRGFVGELVYHAEFYQDSALGFMGCVGNQFIHSEQLSDPMEVDLLGGYRGILYRRRFFNASIFTELEELNRDGVFLADDQLFAWHLARNGFQEMVIPTRYGLNGPVFKFLNLGGGIFEGDAEKSTPSLKRVRKMFGRV
jgi:hypothetical protein